MDQLEDPLRAHVQVAMDAGDTGDYAALSSKIERYFLTRRAWSFDTSAVNFVKQDGKGKGKQEQGPEQGLHRELFV